MTSSASSIIPDVLKELEGTWRGEGVGVYPPRITPFYYLEELTIKALPKPNIWELRSSTKHKESLKPMHSEIGYIRCQPTDSSNGTIELTLVHPFGVSEICHGEFHGMSISLSCEEDGLQRTNTAKSPQTTALTRTYQVTIDQHDPSKACLEFYMDMATTETSMQNHLTAKLFKVKSEF